MTVPPKDPPASLIHAPFPTLAVSRGAVTSVKARPPADRAAASALTDGAAPLSTMVAVGLAARRPEPES